MIDYTSYYKINEYLEKDDMKALKKYLETEREKYYLKTARKALMDYYKHDNFMKFYAYYIDKLLLCDGYSIYILNSDEILTPSVKTRYFKPERANRIINIYEASNKNFTTATSIEKDKEIIDRIVMQDNEGNSVLFNKNFIGTAKKFLGEAENINYEIDPTGLACRMTSNRGKGLILGIKEKK